MIRNKTQIFGVQGASFWLWCAEAKAVTFRFAGNDGDSSDLTLFVEGDVKTALDSLANAVADARRTIAQTREEKP